MCVRVWVCYVCDINSLLVHSIQSVENHSVASVKGDVIGFSFQGFLKALLGSLVEGCTQAQKSPT